MKMNPANRISDASVRKIIALVNKGATVLIDSVYYNAIAQQGVQPAFKEGIAIYGKGKFVATPYWDKDFSKLQLPQALYIEKTGIKTELNNSMPQQVAVQHRYLEGKDIYFISNQNNEDQTYTFSFYDKGLLPEIYDPVTGKITAPYSTDTGEGGLKFFESFAANESKFIVFEKKGIPYSVKGHEDELRYLAITFRSQAQDWTLKFPLGKDTVRKNLPAGGLKSWTEFAEPEIKYFSGTAYYSTTFKYKKLADSVISMHWNWIPFIIWPQ